ncbi:cytochrome oxidase putative small subunit CydP [Acinetobacter soli]|uniref:cytochrome oxidase putative small subunit CydP n=1 Tax=Acinetobacter soli TaxID=487316 RepID=UPI00353079B3
MRELTLILILKLILLISIKLIWFDHPTTPKNFDHHAAEHIAGSLSSSKETR